MTHKQGKRYSAEFKFKVVMEALTGERSAAEVARKYQIHPITLSGWKQHFQEHGAEVFTERETENLQARRIRQLEQMLGRKEVELALAKNFLDKA